MKDGFMLFGYDRKRTSTLTLDSQPGAHTGSTRKYIPGYSSSNIVYLNTSTGNDANDGSTALLAKLTYASAATAAGSTKKIRLVNSATLTDNITKPTEATIGTTSSISSDTATAFNTWSSSTAAWAVGHNLIRLKWFWQLDKFVLVGGSAASKIGYSSDGLAFTESTTGFGTSVVYDIDYADDLGLLIAVGADGKIETSPDGITWTTRTSGTSSLLSSVVWSKALSLIIAAGNSNTIITSPDGISWTAVNGMSQEIINDIGSNNIACLFADSTHILAGTNMGNIYRTTDGNNWVKTTITNSDSVSDIAYGAGVYFAGVSSSINPSFTSTDGIVWAANAGTKAIGEQVIYANDLRLFISANAADGVFYSADAVTWTAASPAPSVRYGVAYSPKLGRLVGTGAGTIRYSDLVAVTVSSSIAGFSVGPVLFSGSLVAYNCTFNAPHTTAALSLDSCRVTESGSHISNNAVTSTATLYEGDRHTTCTPASQNAIDCNLDTVGGTWYIYNASATAYERIRDCLVEGGIVAKYNVTVSGRANVRGTSSNVLFGATVTHRDPKFVDTTDYKLQFQSNGYARNSLAAGRSALYFNSAGDARDIGAWSYVESAVSYYFAKNVYLPKGQITHSIEEVVSEQQGDSGAVSVYGNVNRIKEVITIKYNTEAEADFNVIRAMRLLTDKTVLIQLDPTWSANAGTVVANGNHSIGVDVLNIDSTATYNGMTVTISGKTYYPMRMEPNLTATTRLILDRPLEDAVSDNDVISRNYPSGAGEYQYAAQSRLDLARIDATVMTGYRSGFIIRLVRAYQ